jgi:hypothetical protein
MKAVIISVCVFAMLSLALASILTRSAPLEWEAIKIGDTLGKIDSTIPLEHKIYSGFEFNVHSGSVTPGQITITRGMYVSYPMGKWSLKYFTMAHVYKYNEIDTSNSVLLRSIIQSRYSWPVSIILDGTSNTIE